MMRSRQRNNTAVSRIRFILTSLSLLVQNKAFVHHSTVLPPITRITSRTPLHALATPRNSKKEETNDVLLGTAIDTLNKDYETILTHNPDYSIYDPTIQCISPNGDIKLSGLRSYKTALSLLHAIVPLMYTDCSMQHRVVYTDRNTQTIRIHWHVQAHPRVWKAAAPHALDGISVYHVSSQSGNITQHCIERLLWQPPAAATTLWQQVVLLNNNREAAGVAALPNCARGESAAAATIPLQPSNTVLQFAQSSSSSTNSPPSLLFSGMDDAADASFDWEALESRNKSRRKFGLKPLTPEEFTVLQQEIQTLSDKQQQQQQQQTSTSTTVPKLPQRPNFLENLRNAWEQTVDTCSSNFDCERPLVCCDFGLAKRCCRSGAMVGPAAYGRLVPVPADTGLEQRQGRPGRRPLPPPPGY